jgi:hypothetical protein
MATFGADVTAHNEAMDRMFPDGARCESGWTGDRCQLPLFHDGEHDNEYGPVPVRDEIDAECVRCGDFTNVADRAEVEDGLVHASCMLPGEAIA